MDDNLKAKANPTIALILDYLAVGVVLGIYFFMVETKVVPPNGFEQLLTAVLAALGIYRASSPGTKPVTSDTPVKVINVHAQPDLKAQPIVNWGENSNANKT